MQQLIDTMSNKDVLKIVKQIEDAHKGLPHLPTGVTEFLVKIAPYLAVIGGILSLLGGVQMIVGMNSSSALLTELGISNNYRFISGLEQIILGALYLWSFTYLKNRSLTGWLMMFWGMIISIVFSLISVAFFGLSSIVGVIIGLLIGGYILFEVKPHYSTAKHVADKVAEDIKDA